MIALAEDIRPVDQTQAVPMPIYFTASRVGWCLRNWGNLLALAEAPGTAHGLTFPEPTPNVPRLGKLPKGAHGDQLRYADIVCDIQRAAGQALVSMSVEWYTVHCWLQGHNLGWLTRIKQWTRTDIDIAFEHACELMSAYLEGEQITKLHAYDEAEPILHNRICGRCTEPFRGRADAEYCGDSCRKAASRARQRELGNIPDGE